MHLSGTVQVSSTYCFQKHGVGVYVDRARSSTSSMTIFAIVTDAGEPTAVPEICW